MSMFFGIIGMLGFPCCLIWLIVNAVRWEPKKPPLIGMLLCVVLFFAGVVMDGPENKDTAPEDLRQQSEQTRDLQENDPQLDGSGDKDDASLQKDVGSETDASLKTGDYELPSGVKLHFYDSVHNDVTGKWRRSGTTSALPPADFAIEYYETMFSSDDEIHSVWNATLKTTTKISVSGNILFVDTFEYVDGEEQDAKKMFSGMLLDSQAIDLETGKPHEEALPELEVRSQPDPSESQAKVPPVESGGAKPVASSSGSPKTGTSPASKSGNGEGSNFFTYDNEEQQKTEDSWVLNTSSMKIHYPSCREVKKIAPQNYSTSNLSESELIANGYTTCGVCH